MTTHYDEDITKVALEAREEAGSIDAPNFGEILTKHLKKYYKRKKKALQSKPIECWHGVNSSPEYYPFDNCSRILVPFNLVYERKIKIDWIKDMQDKAIKIMIDSGAARYFLNPTEKELELAEKRINPLGYPKGYLSDYLDFLEEIKPTYAFALDFCFERKEFKSTKKLVHNFISQINSIGQARERGLVLLPVIQGWDKKSYQHSARFTNSLLKLYNRKEFGIGSICRAEKKRVRQVLSWICKIIDLTNAHGFGQTQRTIPILRKYGVARVDTSNATGNAGHRTYCDPFGKWFYGRNSLCKPKHNFEDGFETKKELYQFLFKRNYQAIEFACDSIPEDWIHPVHRNRLDRYFPKEVKSHA